MIHSLLDTDLYKFTMAQAVLHQFPGVEVEFKFACRNHDPNELLNMEHELRLQIEELGELRTTSSELDFLGSLRFIKPDFVDFMRGYHLNPTNVFVTRKDGALDIRVRGSWLQTIFWEVPLLALVNELFFKRTMSQRRRDEAEDEGVRRLTSKIALVRRYKDEGIPIKFCDFGTRRRWSSEWHERVVTAFKTHCPENFVGTSNVYLAKELQLTPIGTMAHEWLQAGQALTAVRESQRFMLDAWVKEYRGDLGIALSDVVGIDAFLRDFDLYFAKLYDGVRHDSGDPFTFGEKVITHYNALKIDPKTKTLVFSDNLDLPKAENIWRAFHDRIGVSFGIGTNLTNDMGVKPLNVVIKMVSCNGQPVAKLSDSPGKMMCEDERYVNFLRGIFKCQ